MTPEIIEKIARILNTPSPSESDVQHLFTLSRKLIERVPPADRPNFALLRFYCDWAVHSEIDRSAEGALILEQLHKVIRKNIEVQVTSDIIPDLSVALAFATARDQLNSLLQRSTAVGTSAHVSREQWSRIVPRLLEIISHCPLKIDASRKGLRAIIVRVTSTPIKGRSVVQELAIIRMPKVVPGQTQPVGEIYGIQLTMSDTMRIMAPVTLA